MLEHRLGCTKPKLLIQGTRDEFGSPASLTGVFDQFSEPKKLVWVEGGDHFLRGKLDELGRAIGDYFSA